MKCDSCEFRNADSSKFCSHCGSRLAAEKRCPACSSPLRKDGNFCRNCGTDLRHAPDSGETLWLEASENETTALEEAAREAFFRRLAARLRDCQTDSSPQAAARRLTRRAIELDLAASLSDLAAVVEAAARPYSPGLQARVVFVRLSDFLATIGQETEDELAKIDQLCCQVASSPAAEKELEPRLRLAFLDLVAAYSRLWPPLFDFVEDFLGSQCHRIWLRPVPFELAVLQ